MITFEQLKQKGYIIEVNTTGAMIVDTIDPDNIPLTSLQEATYTQKNIIYDNCEQTYDLVDVSTNDIVYSANDIDDLIDDFLEHPEIGAPLFGPLINTVTRGARLRKFYLRSAATGVGKSRSMIADACYLSCEKYYQDDVGLAQCLQL